MTDMTSVPLRWSDSGPSGQRNAFGEIISTQYSNGYPTGVVCMHGGSMWLCQSCMEKALAVNDTVRLATPEERAWLKNGSQGPFPLPPPRKSFWRPTMNKTVMLFLSALMIVVMFSNTMSFVYDRIDLWTLITVYVLACLVLILTYLHSRNFA